MNDPVLPPQYSMLTRVIQYLERAIEEAQDAGSVLEPVVDALLRAQLDIQQFHDEYLESLI